MAGIDNLLLRVSNRERKLFTEGEWNKLIKRHAEKEQQACLSTGGEKEQTRPSVKALRIHGLMIPEPESGMFK